MRTKSINANVYDIRGELAAHMGRLWRYGLVLSRQRDIAEDLVQATCLRAMERAHQFQPGTRLDRWLITILHSIWIDEIRSRRVRSGNGFVEPETALVLDGEHDIETRTMANQILRNMSALPEAQRTTAFLTYVEGFSYREAADILNIPVGTVMSRLARAREILAGGQCCKTTSEHEERRI